MKKYEFRLITIEDIPAMCQLLMCRQNNEVERFPSLKSSCNNEEYITELLQELFDEGKVIGMGAFINDELLGYITGEVKIDSLRGRGRHIWIPYEGVAIRMDQPSEIIRELYTKVSVLWIEHGCFNHHTFVPLGEKKYFEAFQGLGFFTDHVYGIMDVDDYKPFQNTCDVSIRLGDKNDGEIMGNMATIIFSALNSAPTFLPVVPEIIERIKAGYKGLVEDEDSTILIAERDGEEVGFQVYEIVDPDLMTPEDTIELNIAGTYSSQRGNGIGKKLMDEGLSIVKDKGYKRIVSDWKMTNLSASTFWPKCGLKPIAYRMVRTIDNNIMWANFSDSIFNNRE